MAGFLVLKKKLNTKILKYFVMAGKKKIQKNQKNSKPKKD